MGFKVSSLWTAPEVNPINKKARSVPILNVLNVYGRVFFFSWFSFMIAFWSWYAFPPLLEDIIRKDIHLSKTGVLNSNIIALVATLLVRLVAGPCCDRYGPRWTFAGCLLAGAIPTFLAGCVYNPAGLMVLRFFIGILGGSFVPCQVWTTGFYDKNIVGTANSITAGLGNAGGGITYFVMPAVYNSLVGDGLSEHTAWRVAFIVPGILIVAAAVALLVLCPDTPTGKWSEREQAAQNNLRSHSLSGAIVDVPGHLDEARKAKQTSSTDSGSGSGSNTPTQGVVAEEKKLDNTRGTFNDHEAQMGEEQMLDTARGEVVQKPSFKEIFAVILTPQTMVMGAAYFCSFGAELSINSILGNYYHKNFPALSLQTRGSWAAMFGLMNVVWRPLGGLVGDIVYNRTKSVWSKKILLHSYGLIMGGFLVALGASDPHNLTTMVCLIGIGLAFFLEGANGLTYSVVPHVHPHANGVVSGFTGACGNLGGIIFAIIFRYEGTNFGRSIWIIGVIAMAIHVCVCWINPIPKGQIGGR
ncbi:nitrate transporter [Polychaeton citri CBS 116435]|uniref:Nitrate/nitrite transporter n=1 Tax=Polychaeton citri CBS 116435 TaxID=1314669 RepID=A0A9P4QC24_9PEZI|nr:nitrate transporter [Polychaeton citri CBS 116435]